MAGEKRHWPCKREIRKVAERERTDGSLFVHRYPPAKEDRHGVTPRRSAAPFTANSPRPFSSYETLRAGRRRAEFRIKTISEATCINAARRGLRNPSDASNTPAPSTRSVPAKFTLMV